MQHATVPARKWWFRFTLRDCLIGIFAIAATIAAAQMYEWLHPPAQLVTLRATVYQANAEKLREIAGGWRAGQLLATSQVEVAEVVDQLQAIQAAVMTSSPSLRTRDGQEGMFSVGGSIPVVDPKEGSQKQIGWAEVGITFRATPKVLPNGRIRFDMAWRHLRLVKDFLKANKTIPASYMDGSHFDPVIQSQEIAFPTELAPDETMFFFDAGDGPDGEGIIVKLQVNLLKDPGRSTFKRYIIP